MAERRGACAEAVEEARRFKAYNPSGDLERVLFSRAQSRGLRASPLPGDPVLDTVECEQGIDGVRFRDADRAEVNLNAAIWKLEAYWAFHLRNPEAKFPWDSMRVGYGTSLERATALAPTSREVVLATAACWCRDLLWRPGTPVPEHEMSRGALPAVTALSVREDLDARTRSRSSRRTSAPRAESWVSSAPSPSAPDGASIAVSIWMRSARPATWRCIASTPKRSLSASKRASRSALDEDAFGAALR